MKLMHFKKWMQLSLLMLALVGVNAQATPITWSLSNVVFSKNSTNYAATGSFTYDADTATYSNLNLTMIEKNFSTDPNFANATNFFTTTLSHSSIRRESYEFTLFFESDLTNAGGNINLSNWSSLRLRRYETSFPTTLEQYDFVSGAVSATTSVSAVPVPAAAWLFGSGLVGLAGLRRRKQQS